jgi:hypothetical protein
MVDQDDDRPGGFGSIPGGRKGSSNDSLAYHLSSSKGGSGWLRGPGTIRIALAVGWACLLICGYVCMTFDGE